VRDVAATTATITDVDLGTADGTTVTDRSSASPVARVYEDSSWHTGTC
jgi:hypothetical protein